VIESAVVEDAVVLADINTGLQRKSAPAAVP